MERTYTTTRGKTIRFVGIQSLLDKLRTSFTMPKKPQYAVKSKLSGATSYFDHDETTLDVKDDPEQTAKNHAEWDAYTAESNRIGREYGEAIMRLVLLRGIQYDEPTDDAWIKEQEFIGLTVPTDPIERKLHYITTEVIEVNDAIEAEKVLLGAFAASSVGEDTLAAMADSFRRSLGKPNRNKTDGAGNPTDGSGLVL